MSNRKYFGTDGIRGRVGDAPITPDFVLKLGWAARFTTMRLATTSASSAMETLVC